MIYKKSGKLLANIVVGAGVFLILDTIFLKYFYFSIKEEDLGEPFDTDEKIKLVLVTNLDVHNKDTVPNKTLARKINSINPDLILFLEDESAFGKEDKAKSIDTFLNYLRDNIPKVSVSPLQVRETAIQNPIKNVFYKHNAHLLVNESNAFNIKGKRIVISGFDNAAIQSCDFDNGMKVIGEEKYHMLLLNNDLLHEELTKKIKEINLKREYTNPINISYIFTGQARRNTSPSGWHNTHKPYLFISKGLKKTTNKLVNTPRKPEILVFNYHV